MTQLLYVNANLSYYDEILNQLTLLRCFVSSFLNVYVQLYNRKQQQQQLS